MAEYIDREKLLERMKYYFEHTGGDAHYTYGVAMREIENAPAEDVVPVREGKWIYDHTYTGKQKEIYYCSRCNHYQYRRKSEQRKKMNYMMYCPFCGAKMDGEVIQSMKRAGDSAEKAAESLKNVIGALEHVVRCVRCVEIVPEGRQVCPGCETGGDCDG